MMRRSAKRIAHSLARRPGVGIGKLRSMRGGAYYTVVIPYVTVGRTAWHPTDPSFAPITRGAFKTAKLARAWAVKHLGQHAQFGLRKFEGS